MAKIYSEDAYCIGLLYSYIYGDKKMVLKSDLDCFYKTIENNLKDTDAMDMYAMVWGDNEPSIYYTNEGKNGDVYCVLYPDFDLKKAKSLYIGCLSTQVLIATLQENALNCLDLQIIDGNISRKEKNNDCVTNSKIFMNTFLEKLKNGELKIEHCPQCDSTEELSEEFIIKQLESYQKLLDSAIIDETINKEKESIKKFTINKK